MHFSSLRKFRRLAPATVAGAAVAGGALFLGTPTASAYVQADVNCVFSRFEMSCPGADLEDYYSVLQGIPAGKNLDDANMMEAVFIALPLRDVTLSNANLSGALLAFSDFTRSVLSNTQGPTDFTEAILVDAALDNSNHAGSKFARANLTNANFAGADLTGANLSAALVEGADFSNVVGLTREQFETAGTSGTPRVYPPNAPVIPPVIPPVDPPVVPPVDPPIVPPVDPPVVPPVIPPILGGTGSFGL